MSGEAFGPPGSVARDPVEPAAQAARDAARQCMVARLHGQLENTVALMAVADRIHADRIEALQAESSLRSPSGDPAALAGGTPPGGPIASAWTASDVPPARPVLDAIEPTSSGRTFDWPAELPRSPLGLRAIRVVAISGESTFRAMGPECSLRGLAGPDWEQDLAEHRPHLLLVQGSEAFPSEHWGAGGGRASPDLFRLLESCRQMGVATALWDDGSTSLPGASLQAALVFDHVFTIDLERIPEYRAALGDAVGVHWLPHAVRPSLHHPITSEPREDAVALVEAAADTVSSGERGEPAAVVRDLSRWRPIHRIGSGTSIDPAVARRFRYAYVIAAAAQSQGTVDQRVLEVLSAGALVASSFDRSLRVLMGELVVCADDSDDLVTALEARADDPVATSQVTLLALRRVLGEHTWQDRLARVASRVWAESIDPRPEVVVLSTARTEAELQRVLELFGSQRYPHKRLHVVGSEQLASLELPEDVVLTPDLDPGQRLAEILEPSLPPLTEGSRWLAVLDERDHYGPDYLTDLAIATRYSGGRSVGKPEAGFRWSDNGLRMPQWHTAHSPSAQLSVRSSLVAESAWRTMVVGDMTPEVAATAPGRTLSGIATDHFHYCRDGAAVRSAQDLAVLDVDAGTVDTGISLASLVEVEQRLSPDRGPTVRGRVLPAACLVDPVESQVPADVPITMRLEGTVVHCEASLPEEEHAYVYARDSRQLSELGVTGELRLHLTTSDGLPLHVVALFLDEGGSRIGHLLGPPNRNLVARVPGGARAIRLGVRVAGTGSARIESLVVGARHSVPPLVLGSSRYLLLTDHYPASTDLYRNAFIHRRVKAYEARGIRVDVFAAGPDRPLTFEEYDGIGVTRGSFAAVGQLLRQNRYEHILVHFLSQDLWSAVAPAAGDVPITVWVHGAEIQPWWRRPFNLVAPEHRERVVWSSDTRREFWRELLHAQPLGMNLVFVSRTFALEALDDLGIEPGQVRWTVIHNPVDTTIFHAENKPPEARLRIWSIRPFASEKYANDLTVDAILELSARPEFPDLQFLVVGDGPLFESTNAPLAGMPNVVVQRGFLTQEQIAGIHREHGVFLVPTRWDSQGVSRDEAMAMGLVPITNAVAAVPEFVDESCAVLCAAEDSSAIVDGLLRLYRDPALFQAMSQAAMQRVRQESESGHVTDQELALFCGIRGG